MKAEGGLVLVERQDRHFVASVVSAGARPDMAAISQGIDLRRCRLQACYGLASCAFWVHSFLEIIVVNIEITNRIGACFPFYN